MLRTCWLALLGCAVLTAQTGESGKLAPYYPTPATIVEEMLKLGGLKAGEKVFDLGSGDGRVVIMAARKFHADPVGIELGKGLVEFCNRASGPMWGKFPKRPALQAYIAGRHLGAVSQCPTTHPE